MTLSRAKLMPEDLLTTLCVLTVDYRRSVKLMSTKGLLQSFRKHFGEENRLASIFQMRSSLNPLFEFAEKKGYFKHSYKFESKYNSKMLKLSNINHQFFSKFEALLPSIDIIELTRWCKTNPKFIYTLPYFFGMFTPDYLANKTWFRLRRRLQAAGVLFLDRRQTRKNQEFQNFVNKNKEIHNEAN